jgi:hypothetical protein
VCRSLLKCARVGSSWSSGNYESEAWKQARAAARVLLQQQCEHEDALRREDKVRQAEEKARLDGQRLRDNDMERRRKEDIWGEEAVGGNRRLERRE